MSLDADSAVVLVDDCDTIQCIHPDGDRVCRRSLLLSWPSWMLALGMWQPAAQGAAAPSVALDQEKDGNMYTFKSSLPGQGFSFRYPASDFVIAYDRTQDASRQGAIISIGNFTNTIYTATVFRQSIGDMRVPRTPEDAYKLCIQPLIDDASTTGFRLMQDSLMTTVDGVAIYEYQYEQSICRGQEIVEGVGGVLRCTGTYGQDVPIQKKRILAKTLFLPHDQRQSNLDVGHQPTTTLLTMQASTNDETMRAIIESFIPL